MVGKKIFWLIILLEFYILNSNIRLSLNDWVSYGGIQDQ